MHCLTMSRIGQVAKDGCNGKVFFYYGGPPFPTQNEYPPQYLLHAMLTFAKTHLTSMWRLQSSTSEDKTESPLR